MTQNKTICIFGGSGFLGKNIIQELARAGYRIKIATRIPESAYELKTYGTVGQIVACQCNYNDSKSIDKIISGCDGVINLVGILFEKGKNNFKRAHIDIPAVIAQSCKDHDVEKFIHVSALGINSSVSKYAKSKLEGEKVIKDIFPNVTFLRPSVIFGAGDSFFNMFAKLSAFLPALPLIGGGKTKFQPVYVGDVAEAAIKILMRSDDEYEARTYHLGGPDVVSFKEIYEILLKETNRERKLLNIPWPIARIQGTILGLLPKPPLTLDQVRSLKKDNIVKEGERGFDDLGISPTAMETILPLYLACYKRGGRFSNKKTA
jgi:NADH dehydrogenase